MLRAKFATAFSLFVTVLMQLVTPAEGGMVNSAESTQETNGARLGLRLAMSLILLIMSRIIPCIKC